MENTINQDLSAIEASGLIRLAQVEPELAYIFKHALVQEVAYESLLRSDRKRMHRLVGESLERLYPGQEHDLAPVLAHHFQRAEDQVKALKYYTLAGDLAARRFANTEAVAFYSSAI